MRGFGRETKPSQPRSKRFDRTPLGVRPRIIAIAPQKETRPMKTYKLPYVLYPPSQSTEPDKYMAEIPILPGCMAWGDTPAETVDILQSVAAATIELSIEDGDELPSEVQAALVEPDVSELMVSV